MAKEPSKKESLGEIFTRDFLILATINLTMFFGFQMTTVGIPVYMAQLGAEAHVVGLATTLMTITATLMRVFAGALLDRFGRTGLLIGGTVVMICSIISYAIFPVVGIIMGLRLIQGIGWGAGSTASSTIAADIIPKRRFAEGMGYFAMTNAISSALAPAVSIELAQGAGGVYMVYVSAGITCIALVLAIVQTLLQRHEGKGSVDQEAESRPTGQGKAPGAGGAPGTPDSPNGPGGPGAPGAPDGPNGPNTHGAPGGPNGPGAPGGPGAPNGPYSPGGPPASKLETIFERRAVVPGLLMLLVNIGFGTITTFIALHAQSRGVMSVSPYFVVYAVVTLLSRPLIGKLIDRYGYRMPAILSTLCTAGTLVMIGMSSSVPMFALSGVLGGLGLGTAMGTYQSMAVASVEPWRRGVATSTYMTGFDLGIAIGAFAGGFIAAAFGYDVMYYCVALFPLAACILSLFAVKKGEGVASK